MSRFLSRFLRWGALSLAVCLAPAAFGAERIIRAENMTIARGATNRLYITLESLGDESAMGFTLGYDTNQLTFIRAFRGSSATNNFDLETYPLPSLTTNIIHAASKGLLGLAINLDVTLGQVWPPGSNRIIEVHFRAVTNGGTVITPIWFTNFPIARGVSDGDANPLPAVYADATVSIQGACSYSLNTNAAAFGDAGGAGSVNIAADPACPWIVINTNSWIAITSATNSSGNATVSYSVAANVAPSLRSGTFKIAGELFTVTQQGIICTYALNTNAAFISAEAGSASVMLTTPAACTWQVDNTNSWITITSLPSGSGSAEINYSFVANPTMTARSGIIIIAGENFTITQAGAACVYNLNSNAASYSASGGSGSVAVTTTASCAWTVQKTSSWITITSATNGSGNGTISYFVAPNSSSVPRAGTLVIGGENFSITQLGILCSYALSTNGASFNSDGGAGSVALVAISDCGWSVSNTNAWIDITSPSSGAGTAPVNFTVAANPGLTVRSGTITIAGRNFVVTQQGVSCNYQVSPTTGTHSFAAATNSISVTVSNPCPWSVVNTNPWITILSGGSGAGSGNVIYVIAQNPTSFDRSGTLQIAGVTVSVTQQGACIFSITPSQRTHGYGATNNSFAVTTGGTCPWVVINTNAWITIFGGSGTGNGTVQYSIEQNRGAERIGVITVEGSTFVITQSATPCSFTLSPASRTLGSFASTGIVNVTPNGAPHCPWTATTTNDWIIITSNPNGTNGGSIAYSVLANTNAALRTGAIFVEGQTFTLTQFATSDSFDFQSIRMDGDQVALKIAGTALGVWELQLSLDLTTWTRLRDVTNTTGTLDLIIPGSGATNAFYRMKLP